MTKMKMNGKMKMKIIMRKKCSRRSGRQLIRVEVVQVQENGNGNAPGHSAKSLTLIAAMGSRNKSDG